MFRNPLISEYPPEYFDSIEFGQRMLAWVSMCGIKDTPDPITLGFVVNALQNEYAHHSFEEVELALRMYIIGELGDELEAYNNFNLKFLAKVMLAYRKIRKATATKYEEIKYKIERPKQHIPSDVEKELMIMQTIWEDYNRLLNDMEVLPWEYKADLLIKYKIIPVESVDANLTGAGEIIKRTLATTVDMRERLRLTDVVADEGQYNAACIKKAKCLTYLQWLEQLKKDKQSFIYFDEITNTNILAPKQES